MSGAWSNDGVTSLTIPTGATSGARIIIDGLSGNVLVYDASNNLVGVINAADYFTGADFLPPGATFGILNGTTADTWVAMDPNGSGDAGYPSINLHLPRANGIDYNHGILEAVNFGAPNYNPTTLVRSPTAQSQNPFFVDEARVYAIARSTNGVSPSSVDLRADQVQLIRNDGANGCNVLVNGTVSVYDPANTSVKETWHGLPFATGWGNFGSGNVSGQYKLEPDNSVRVVGVIVTSAGWTANVTTALPAAYRPAHRIRQPCYGPGAFTGAINYLDLNTSGVLSLVFNPSAVGQIIELNASFPLDA
jgi:hypothetical protein